MAVFDCCYGFLNENDLYEVRLNQHWDYVDRFIVVEARETHTGVPRELQFDKERFKPYESKITYVTFDNFADEIPKYPELLDPVGSNSPAHNMDGESWKRCSFQSNYFIKVLEGLGAKSDDIVLATCTDEIIRGSTFERAFDIFADKEIPYPDGWRPILQWHSYLYAYKMNLLHLPWQQHTIGFMTEFSNLYKALPATLRHTGFKFHNAIPDGGWHFTFLDNKNGEMVLEKQRSWAHSKDIYPGMKTKFDHTTKEEAVDRFWHDYKVQKVDIKLDTHPEYIVNNIEKFRDFIYEE